MPRGREPTRGISEALRLARSRGCVMKYCPDEENLCDFMIRTPAQLVFVRVKRFLKILSAPETIEAELHDRISLLRSLPESDAIACEIWIYSKHLTFRFFRITETGIVEIENERVVTGSPDGSTGIPSSIPPLPEGGSTAPQPS